VELIFADFSDKFALIHHFGAVRNQLRLT
jgi:hypothetical protein